jgi:hypothetical protein
VSQAVSWLTPIEQCVSCGIERPESFDEFQARGLVVLAELGISKRMEQEQNRMKVSVPIHMRSPRPSVDIRPSSNPEAMRLAIITSAVADRLDLV